MNYIRHLLLSVVHCGIKLSMALMYKHLFIETNPIPIKAAMAYKKLIREEYRLPLSPIADGNMDILKKTMQDIGI